MLCYTMKVRGKKIESGGKSYTKSKAPHYTNHSLSISCHPPADLLLVVPFYHPYSIATFSRLSLWMIYRDNRAKSKLVLTT